MESTKSMSGASLYNAPLEYCPGLTCFTSPDLVCPYNNSWWIFSVLILSPTKSMKPATRKKALNKPIASSAKDHYVEDKHLLLFWMYLLIVLFNGTQFSYWKKQVTSWFLSSLSTPLKGIRTVYSTQVYTVLKWAHQEFIQWKDDTLSYNKVIKSRHKPRVSSSSLTSYWL